MSVVAYWHYNNGHTVCIQIQSNLYNKKGHSTEPEIVTYYEQLPFIYRLKLYELFIYYMRKIRLLFFFFFNVVFDGDFLNEKLRP